jgi:hypothetical protein
MRRALWILIAAAVGIAAAIVIPARAVERQITAAIQPLLEPGGTVTVRARASPLGLARGYLSRVRVTAHAIRIGALTAQRLDASLSGVDLVKTASGDRALGRVRGGGAVIEFGRGDLERFLRTRGVDTPEVTIDEAGVSAEGVVTVGGAAVRARVRGQFYSAGPDLLFRIASLQVSGVDVPPAIVQTAMGLVRPAVSLRDLPFPMVIDRVTSEPGRVIVRARVEEAP